MAYTLNYERLRVLAAETLGLDRSALTQDQETKLNEIPNAALDRVSLARAWQHLVKLLSLSTVAGQSYVLLPADFERLERDDAVVHAENSGYGRLMFRDLAWLRERRALATVSQRPTVAAIGPAVAGGADNGRLQLELWPTPDAIYALSGTYRRRPTTMTASADVPDCPTALNRALRMAVQIEALEQFTRGVPPDILMGYERAVGEAAGVLLPAAPNDGSALRRVHGLPRRETRGGSPDVDLAANWHTVVSTP